ncbi:MAG: hypothetical protein ACM34J_10940 [Ignavibacteria bacterium]
MPSFYKNVIRLKCSPINKKTVFIWNYHKNGLKKFFDRLNRESFSSQIQFPNLLQEHHLFACPRLRRKASKQAFLLYPKYNWYNYLNLDRYAVLFTGFKFSGGQPFLRFLDDNH